MTNRKNHIGIKNTEKLADQLLGNMDIPFKSTKSEAWDSINSKMEISPQNEISHVRPVRQWIAVAASLTLLISSALFIIFNSNTLYAEFNETTAKLPDGSEITLEKGSEIAWYPIRWKFQRTVKLDGSAFFDVQKGKTFKVISQMATTEVLGTTFKIRAATDSYQVSCFTGKVKITDKISETSAILLPNEKLLIDNAGKFSVTMFKNEKQNANKAENLYFTFRSKPISEVFNDLEAHYGVEIVTNEILNLQFSGNLKVEDNFEELLTAICLPLELNYEKLSNNKYFVSQGEDQ